MTIKHALKKVKRLKKQRHEILDQIETYMQDLQDGNISFNEYSSWMTKANAKVWDLEQMELKTGSLVIQLTEQKLIADKNKNALRQAVFKL